MIDYTADEYVEDVLSGREIAGQQIVHACRRHQRDLEQGGQRGLRFDERAAQITIAFFGVLCHWKGEWAGEPIHLQPWQQFILASLFGWKRQDGTRRFRTAYLEVARKNGKTTLAAGIGLYLMVADGEPGAEIYTAATKRDQARLAHKDATEMVARSPQLRQIIRTFKDNLHSLESSSKFEPLGRDSNSTDGLNVHGVVADELHAWKTRDMWDVLETATGSRRQPLMLAITTAGFDRQSLCYTLHDYSEKVNNGAVEDDSFFGLIYALDEADDYQEERNWQKANPNLGISKKWDDMRRKLKRAQEMPAALNAFLRLELNKWTQVETRWLDPDVWRRCGGLVEEERLAGRLCYGGLDLSSTTDVSALVYVFPPEAKGAPYELVCRFWIPEDSMHERSRRDRVPYEAWGRHGYLTATPGNVIDYDYILEQIDRDAQTFDLQEIAFDRWGAARIVQQIQERGLTVVQFGQGFASMNAPMKELEKLILSQELAHGDHPVLSWMADNLVARQDPAGNIKPDKERSIEKIDGMVALIMALDRAVRHEEAKRSVYEDRGLIVI
jgi:phage terminase large subunit-like protein